MEYAYQSNKGEQAISLFARNFFTLYQFFFVAWAIINQKQKQKLEENRQNDAILRVKLEVIVAKVQKNNIDWLIFRKRKLLNL